MGEASGEGPFTLADEGGGCEGVGTGRGDVHDDGAEDLKLDGFGRVTGGGDDHGMMVRLQETLEDKEGGRVAVDEQDLAHRGGRNGDRGAARRSTGSGGDGRPRDIVKWNRLPRPSSLSAQRRPPMRATRRAEMVKPRPVPPKRRVVETSAWVNGSKMDSSLSLGIPMPVSATLKWIAMEASDRDSTAAERTTSPAGVNLTALPSRLTRIWRRRRGSPRRGSGMPGERPPEFASLSPWRR